jgi:hypothetical protein
MALPASARVAIQPSGPGERRDRKIDEAQAGFSRAKTECGSSGGPAVVGASRRLVLFALIVGRDAEARTRRSRRGTSTSACVSAFGGLLWAGLTSPR